MSKLRARAQIGPSYDRGRKLACLYSRQLGHLPVFRPGEVNTFKNIDGLPDTYFTCCFCLQVCPFEPCFRGTASLETAFLSVGTGLNGIQFRRRIATRRSRPSSPRSSQMPGSNGCVTLARVWRRPPLGLGPSRGEDAVCYLLYQIPTLISCPG